MIRLGILLALLGLPLSAETLRIGTEADYPPYMSYGSDGELRGFDKDLGDAICAALAADCVWTVGTFDGLLPALAAGEHDLVIAALSASPARREIVDFTTPYFEGGGNVAVYVGLNPNANVDTALIGVQAGTIQADHLALTGREFRTFPTTEAALAALMRREIDLVLTSDLVLREAQETRYPALRSVAEEQVESWDTAIAVGKDNSKLRIRIDAVISALIADGTIARLEARWFVSGTST